MNARSLGKTKFKSWMDGWMDGKTRLKRRTERYGMITCKGLSAA